MVFVIFIFIVAAVFGFATTAAEKKAVEDPEIAQIKNLAKRVIADFGKPYRVVALGVSPAVLPDETDYLLHKPMDLDISIPLDSFKRNYCAVIPADYRLEIVGIDKVHISEFKKAYNRSGVILDYTKLREAVSTVVDDFKPSDGENRFDYLVSTARTATVEMKAKLKMADGSDMPPNACNASAETSVFIGFAEHKGKWRINYISRHDRTECKNNTVSKNVPGMEPTPLYKDCAKPAEQDKE